MDVMAAAMDASGDVAYAWDFADDTIAWAGGAAALLGSDLADGEALRARIEAEDRPRRRLALSQHVETGAPFDCDYRLRLADGGVHWVHDRGRVERDGNGTPVRLRGVLRVIDRHKAYEVELEHQAHFDPLTGLVNRHRLRETLARATSEADTFNRFAIYLAVGIDKLGLVNDAMGHAVADAVVLEVARRLQLVLRPGDAVGRVGGDIFGIVLPHCPEENMAHVAEKLLRAVRATPVATPVGAVHVTVSIGGLSVGADGEDCGVDEVMTRAETALQEAKRQGRDCFWPHHATSAQQSELRNALAVGQTVKAALQGGDLRFAFQPVIGAQGPSGGAGEVSFYECLLRLIGADGAPLAAGAFMPAVERLGMARRLDHHTLDLAMRELEGSADVVLALNLSATTTADRTWLSALDGRIGGRPDLAKRLIVEITETAAIEDLEETAAFLTAVRSLGCRTALDDFGAGYLSYRHLKALPVDIVKIDGSFVRELKEGPDALLFIRTLVGLAKGFGLTTVAECVEDDWQADILRRERVCLLQGYRFGRPSLDRPWAEPRALAAD